MTDLWYPITATHPSPLVQVRGIVEIGTTRGYDAELIISRGKPPHDSTWVEWVKGKPIKLPPHATPCLWQPKHPDKWSAPLPPPVPIVESRFWSSRQSFNAVEAAREMEEWREAARANQDEPKKEKLAWWRDITEIRYEHPGAVTPKMAEGRVMRAVAFSAHGQGLTLKAKTAGKLLADLAAAGAQEAYATSDYVPRLRPLPQDQNDFDQAMAWFVALDPVELRVGKRARYATWDFTPAQMVLIWRSFDVPLSWATIAERFGDNHHEYARKRFESAIKTVTRVANGLPAYSHLPTPADQIEALRERNRAAKRVA